MLNTIPPEITIASFSLIGVLTGYVWNSQNKRISKIEKIQNNRPCNKISRIVVEMRTDLKWIKCELKKIK